MQQPVKTPVIRQRQRPQTSELTEVVSAPSYAVGYGKPPAEHRFKPGQSGNPKGRRKGSRGVNAMLRDMLEQKVAIREGLRTRNVPRIEALLLKQIELASKGDTRALAQLVTAYRQAVPDSVAPPEVQHDEDVSVNDQAILDAFAAQVLRAQLTREQGE